MENLTANVEVNETKRSDLFRVDPRNIKIEEGFNIRNIDVNSDGIKHLKLSIKENGLQRPLVLKNNPNAEVDGKEYLVVDGHRRMTAVLSLLEDGEPIEYVKAEISKRMNDEQALISMFTLNDGEPLNPIEKAEGVRRLIEVYGYEPKEVAVKIAENQSTVSNLLKLASMPKAVKKKVAGNIISASFAIELARKSKNDEEFAKQVEELTKGVEEATKESGKKRAKVTAKKATHIVGEKNVVKLLEQTALALEKEEVDNDKVDLLFKLVTRLKKNATLEEIKELFL